MVCRRKLSSRKRGNGILSLASKIVKGIAGTAGDITSTIINKLINASPEIHLPGGYQWCGPGTKVNERLKRGDEGINSLDRACKVHDIAYTQNSDNKSRAIADRAIANTAWEIFKNPKSSLSERALSYLVTNVMKAKAAFGGGLRKKKKKKSTVKTHSSSIRKKAIAQLKQHIAGKGYYLKPYPPISRGGRILIGPTSSSSSPYGVSLFPKKKRVKKRRTTKKVKK